MPELPEVETVRRSLIPWIVGQCVQRIDVRDHRLRSSVDAAALEQTIVGHCIVGVRRRAKYLLLDTDNQQVLMIHLGMSGKLGVVHAQAELRRHDHVVWHLSNGQQMRYNDARRFGLIEVFAAPLEALHVRLQHLGVEPLDDNQLTPAYLYALTRQSNKPIKNFLLDGTRVVGIGNIYACEALFFAGIHPATPASALTKAQCRKLVCAIVQTLKSAIEQGGTTLRDFTNVLGESGYFAVRLQVYGREKKPCLHCEKLISRVVQSGRSTFYCAACQL